MKSEVSLSVSEPVAFLCSFVTGLAFMYVLRISIARLCDKTAGVGVTAGVAAPFRPALGCASFFA